MTVTTENVWADFLAVLARSPSRCRGRGRPQRPPGDGRRTPCSYPNQLNHPDQLIGSDNTHLSECAGSKPLCVKWVVLGAVDLAGFPAGV